MKHIPVSLLPFLFWKLMFEIILPSSLAFCPATTITTTAFTTSRATRSTSSSSSSLFAIGVLAKKAKQADLRKYVQEGVEDKVMEVYNRLKKVTSGTVDDPSSSSTKMSPPGPLQQALTRRKGTLTVIAEFKRKNSQCNNGRINELLYDPINLSPTFREFGASAVAVLADERMGGCNYNDLAYFAQEQSRARNDVPGPLLVINNDLIIDELQIARTAAVGANACVLTLAVVGKDELPALLRACQAVDIEAIVAVSTKEEAQQAIDMGARILSVVNIDGVDDKVAVVEGLKIPDGQQVCTIANILAKGDSQLLEIEEAWAIRDKGFNCAWVGEALYKAGSDQTEHPGAIIRSMKSKSSLKWASAKASTGRGEGAREYLGDIMM